MGYCHLSIDEREVILKMRENNKTLEEIGFKLRRSRSTVSRELQRNVSSTGEYKAHLAEKYYQRKQYWSPEQICGQMEREYP